MTVYKLFNIISIETRNVCTRKCWFCKFGQVRQDETSVIMSWTTIEKIVSNLRDLDYSGRISWYVINEPLMDKRITEIIRYTREQCPKSFINLITNGDLLDKEKFVSLRKAGLDALGVSVYDDKTFQKIGTINDRKLVMIDKRNPGPDNLENRGGNVKKNGHLFEPKRKRMFERSCERPSNMLNINTKGEAILCCADMYSDVIMGDIKEQRLEEIWNNERFMYYRKTLAENGRRGLRLCENCSHDGTTSPVYYPLNKFSLLESAIIQTARRFKLL